MAKNWLFAMVSVLLLRGLWIVSLAIPKSNFTDQSALLAFKAHITSNLFNIPTNNWSTSATSCHCFEVTQSTHHRSRVAALDLFDMGLEGSRPPHMGNLSFLQSIQLSNKKFHGDLPSELGNLLHLKILNMGNNSFSGLIPPSFGRLPYGFSGTRPSSAVNITTLETLSLTGNSLQGKIPEVSSNLYNLRPLRLGFNQLGDAIPRSLCQCREPERLALNDKKFTGSIPEAVGNLTKLVWLGLGPNNFTGIIANEHWKLYLAHHNRNSGKQIDWLFQKDS